MNTYTCDNLDAILTLAATEYAKKLTDEFLSAKPDFDISEPSEQRIMRMIRKDKHRTSRKNAWRIAKYIMVACLIAATVAFTACMAIPRIRQAIWQAIVDWHGDYVSIKFVPIETDALDAATIIPSDAIAERASFTPTALSTVPPESIVEVNVPSYTPIGYTTKSTTKEGIFMLNYYDECNAFAFTYRQMVVDSESKSNAEAGASAQMTINGMNAIVFTYADQPNVYSLYWQDRQYRYNIYGYFEDYTQLIRLATSVDVK